jgi:hypothetical protein
MYGKQRVAALSVIVVKSPYRKHALFVRVSSEPLIICLSGPRALQSWRSDYRAGRQA